MPNIPSPTFQKSQLSVSVHSKAGSCAVHMLSHDFVSEPGLGPLKGPDLRVDENGIENVTGRPHGITNAEWREHCQTGGGAAKGCVLGGGDGCGGPFPSMPLSGGGNLHNFVNRSPWGCPLG